MRPFQGRERGSIPLTRSRISKSNYLFDTAFADFANLEFNKQTELVLKGMKIGGVSLESARQHFSNHFIDYEITSPELGSQGTDPALFKGIENQFIQKIYEDIVKSFILL